MQHSAWTEVWDRGMLTDPGWETPVAARGHCLGYKAEPTAPVSSPTHSTRVCPPKCVPHDTYLFFCVFIERATHWHLLPSPSHAAQHCHKFRKFCPFPPRKSLPGSASCHFCQLPPRWQMFCSSTLYHFYTVAAWLNISCLMPNFQCSQLEGVASPNSARAIHNFGVHIHELSMVFLAGGSQFFVWKAAFLGVRWIPTFWAARTRTCTVSAAGKGLAECKIQRNERFMAFSRQMNALYFLISF